MVVLRSKPCSLTNEYVTCTPFQQRKEVEEGNYLKVLGDKYLLNVWLFEVCFWLPRMVVDEGRDGGKAAAIHLFVPYAIEEVRASCREFAWRTKPGSTILNLNQNGN